MASDSSSEVPGTVSALITSDPSWNSGRNAFPRNGSIASAAATASAAPPTRSRGRRSAGASTRPYHALSVRGTRGSCSASSSFARGRRYMQSAGVSVSATAREARMETM